MISQTVEDFRVRVNGDPALQAELVRAVQDGPDAVSSLARRNGFDIEPAEAAAALDEIAAGAELSDFELDLVAGGGDVTSPVTLGEDRVSAKAG